MEENSDLIYLGKRIDNALKYIQDNKTNLIDWFHQYVETPYQEIVSGELDLEEEDYTFDYLDSLLDDLEEKYNIILETKTMTNEQLRLQMLSGIITEGEYKTKLEEKESLNESMIGGIVGVGAITQIPPREKNDYELAFEHFLGGKYGLDSLLKEEEEVDEEDLDEGKEVEEPENY